MKQTYCSPIGFTIPSILASYTFKSRTTPPVLLFHPSLLPTTTWAETRENPGMNDVESGMVRVCSRVSWTYATKPVFWGRTKDFMFNSISTTLNMECQAKGLSERNTQTYRSLKASDCLVWRWIEGDRCHKVAQPIVCFVCGYNYFKRYLICLSRC